MKMTLVLLAMLAALAATPSVGGATINPSYFCSRWDCG